MDMGALDLDRHLLQAALLDDPRPHAVHGAACVALCLLIAFPVAYGLATRFKPIENEIKVLITFAFITDATLKIYGWVLFLDKNGAANFLLRKIGLPAGMVAFLYTDWATLLGMVYSLLGLRDLHHLSVDQQYRPLPHSRRL